MTARSVDARPTTKFSFRHKCHVTLMFVYTLMIWYMMMCVNHWAYPVHFCYPTQVHGFFNASLLVLSRLAALFLMPQALLCFLGLLLYDTFKKCPPYDAKQVGGNFCRKICVSVVTKGDYPELINFTLARNIEVCRKAGAQKHFIFQLLTEKPVKLMTSIEKEVEVQVVPKEYKTKSGVMFKGRNMQYGLEQNSLSLDDNDWIVHLDEETLMTESAVHGILRFCSNGDRDFGHGLLTLSNNQPTNWLIFAADAIQVSENLGHIRFSFNQYKRPLLSWRGTFIVGRLGAEKDVTFDNGPISSQCEDCYFSMAAAQKGYTFGYVEGVMHEQSPLTLLEWIKQRRRWIYTYYLVSTAPRIQLKYKIFIILRCISWILMPLSCLSMYLLSCEKILTVFALLTLGIYWYMYVFGAVKTLQESRYHRSKLECILLVLFTMLFMPICVFMEAISAMYIILAGSPKFTVTKKTNY